VWSKQGLMSLFRPQHMSFAAVYPFATAPSRRPPRWPGLCPSSGPANAPNPARAPCGRALAWRAHGFPPSHIAPYYRVKVNKAFPPLPIGEPCAPPSPRAHAPIAARSRLDAFALPSLRRFPDPGSSPRSHSTARPQDGPVSVVPLRPNRPRSCPRALRARSLWRAHGFPPSHIAP
jgi:hypothetical protein